jgi:hypothetical protein
MVNVGLAYHLKKRGRLPRRLLPGVGARPAVPKILKRYARDLVAHLQKHRGLAGLVEWIEKSRPDISVDEFLC